MDLQEPTRKMSKSISSPLGTIFLFDEPKDIERKIAKAVTDTDGEVRFDWENKPGISNLLEIYSSFSGESPEVVAERYTRYGDLKRDLAALMNDSLAPLRARYHELLTLPDELYKIADHGAQKASDVAGPCTGAPWGAMGLDL